jgi:predicted NUDIX family NTP pyrophosphohydrolase
MEKPAKKKESAGLLMYRIINGELEVFLSHPGGPFFKNKDLGVWSIPKGEPNDGENDLLQTAIREFEEEIGFKPNTNDFIPLGSILQKGGKTVYAWAFKGDLDNSFELKSNTFKNEWPPNSGKWMVFPEVDRAGFFKINESKKKIRDMQTELIERLEDYLKDMV